ncbi:hypothetical protein NIES2100_76450 [Calothrix sp. NIES-2100]|uniref:hypothetical protein n=1 Tax=Calothrix sp. NIES-2100 TaxID=1954172 RepID=UPI000B605D1E|nr:hypothetical protein NIES2100_76450 [Calothrix sp. NIES-2100]
MLQTFKVCFRCLSHAWIAVELLSQEQQLSFIASYTPYNSFLELIDALLVFLKRSDRTVVRWNTEPIEYEFQFYNHGQQAILDILKLRDCWTNRLANELVLRINSSHLSIVLPFWRALRHLQTDSNFEQQWGRAFPQREMKLLGECIQFYKTNPLSIM